jgi:hypothetical protein
MVTVNRTRRSIRSVRPSATVTGTVTASRNGTRKNKWSRKAIATATRSVRRTKKNKDKDLPPPSVNKVERDALRMRSPKCGLDKIKGDYNNDIYSLLKCAHANGEMELYDFIVNDIIETYYRSDRTEYSFITYVKENYKTFRAGSCATLVRAFTRFQEEVLPTENLEHILQTC